MCEAVPRGWFLHIVTVFARAPRILCRIDDFCYLLLVGDDIDGCRLDLVCDMHGSGGQYPGDRIRDVPGARIWRSRQTTAKKTQRT